MTTVLGHTLYALAWASFGMVHSVLALPKIKDRLRPALGRSYRIAYNLAATVHFALVAALGWWLLGDLPPFPLPFWAVNGLHVLNFGGCLALVLALRTYDGHRLLGLTQRRDPTAPEDEPLRQDGLHRLVRHPIYAAAFPLLWGLATSQLGLAIAVWGSVYLVIGSRLEERQLLALYGETYAAYRRRVPAFVPRLW